MAGAVRLVSTAKGHDAREFTLLAFGGAGPVHAWAVAAELGMAAVVVPPLAGVSSAAGLLQAGFRVDASRGVRRQLSGAADEVRAALTIVADEARAELAGQGVVDIEISVSADMRYAGQTYEVHVELPEPDALEERFAAEHRRSFGYDRPGDPIEVTVVRARATAPGAGVTFTGPVAGAGSGVRRARFAGAAVQGRVLRRSALDGTAVPGPAFLDDDETTIVVPPGASARAGAGGHVVVSLNEGADV
jgi:N-methylhydantoinase A